MEAPSRFPARGILCFSVEYNEGVDYRALRYPTQCKIASISQMHT